MKADGTKQRRLAAGLSPAWSRDWSLIAFSAPSGILSLIRPDGAPGAAPHGGWESVLVTGRHPGRLQLESHCDHVMHIAEADGSKVVDSTSAGERGGRSTGRPTGVSSCSHRIATTRTTTQTCT
jgi:hypothetical protein